jgi:hypothetical protein
VDSDNYHFSVNIQVNAALAMSTCNMLQKITVHGKVVSTIMKRTCYNIASLIICVPFTHVLRHVRQDQINYQPNATWNRAVRNPSWFVEPFTTSFPSLCYCMQFFVVGCTSLCTLRLQACNEDCFISTTNDH